MARDRCGSNRQAGSRHGARGRVVIGVGSTGLRGGWYGDPRSREAPCTGHFHLRSFRDVSDLTFDIRDQVRVLRQSPGEPDMGKRRSRPLRRKANRGCRVSLWLI
jgi:hypothetical protein